MTKATVVKMEHGQWLKSMALIPPTDYESLLITLNHHGYNSKNNYYIRTYTNEKDGEINCVSITESPITMDDTVEKLKKICGKKFRIVGIKNNQEIYFHLNK